MKAPSSRKAADFESLGEAGHELKIDDTTLRDGEQTAGVVFSNHEKITIAKLLDEIGVHQIEAGIPAMGGDEKEAIKAMARLGLRASILAWNRTVISDIEHSLDCGVPAVALSIATSDVHIETKLNKDRTWVLESVKRAVDFAKSHDLYVSVNAEDASRSDFEFLVEFASAVKDGGADRVRFCDTVGVMDPFKSYAAVKRLREAVDIEVEMHTHNDFGMATANAVAGATAGATWINTTVNGLGERAGNAPLEEVVMALKYIHGIDLGIKTQMFRLLSEYVAQASARTVPAWKAIVGAYVFAHESGIHADGVLKNPQTYEAFSPEEVGLERQLLVGKHSGTHALKAKFKDYGMDVSEEDARVILKEVRKTAVRLKRALFDKELVHIYQVYEENKEGQGG